MNSGPNAYPSPARAWWSVAVFSLAAVVSYTDRLILNQLVDPLRRDLAIGDLQASYLLGPAFAVVYVLSGLALGRMADRGHRRNLVLAGAGVWSVGTLACAFAPSFLSLLAARLCVGFGEAVLGPCVVSLLADSFPPERRGTALGTFLMSCVVGTGLAITIGGWLLSAADAGVFAGVPVLRGLASWRVVLAVAGLPGCLILALVATVSEPARREGTGGDGLRDAIRHFAGDRARLAPLYLGMGVMSIGDFAFLAWMPTLLSRRYGLSAGDIGTLMGAIVAGTGIVGSLATGFASDWAERRGGLPARLGLVMAGAALCLPGAALLLLDTSFLALVGASIWMMGTTAVGIAGIAALQEMLPNQFRGTGMSLVAFFNMILGLGLGPSLVAAATEFLFGEGAAVGWAIVTIALPMGGLALLLFGLSRLTARRFAFPQPGDSHVR